jgi:NAD(P)-dependent dehydrogenase (short-subunit alcohol dehydrogenase family)
LLSYGPIRRNYIDDRSGKKGEMTVKLSEKCILVTGASSGLGAHMAAMLAARGARVAAAARRTGALEALAAAVDGRIVPIAMDVSDPDSVEQGVAKAATAMGGLDGLVNNAGVAWIPRSPSGGANHGGAGRWGDRQYSVDHGLRLQNWHCRLCGL